MMMMMFYFAPRIFVVFMPCHSTAPFIELSFARCPNLFQPYMHAYASKITHLFVSFSFSYSIRLLFFLLLHIQHFADSNIRIYKWMCSIRQWWVCARVHIGLSILHVSSFMFLLSYDMLCRRISIDGFLFRSWPFNYMHSHRQGERTTFHSVFVWWIVRCVDAIPFICNDNNIRVWIIIAVVVIINNNKNNKKALKICNWQLDRAK